MKLTNFCVFILSHRRPDKIITLKTLEKHGYTGPCYIIIDNEDKTAEQYYQQYGHQVIMFDKEAIETQIDTGDNFKDRRTILHARNACFSIAKMLGYEYFIELDDDYVDFRYKRDDQGNIINKQDIKSLDEIFLLLLNFYKSIPALSIAIAQGGDYLGGKNGNAAKNPCLRKCMNSFICSTLRPFKFVSTMNEDVSTYISLGQQGNLFLTIPFIALQQKASQSNVGGITALYHKMGTYVKSFYTVMYAPSCTSITLMQSKHPRLHHSISWDNAVSKIISSTYRKRRKG